MTSSVVTGEENPYVGPRALDEGDGLYGRDRDVAALLDLVIAQRIVLVYSPSGAGKTSLLQAGLIPALRDEEGFGVRPIARVSRETPATEGDGNRYLRSVASCLAPGHPAQVGVEPDRHWFAGFLERTRREDAPPNEVLVFDQFEELLTMDPTDVVAKHTFMAQLGDALRSRRRWAVFAMREEYIAGLDPYLGLVPTRLSATFRVDFLRADVARAAIQIPARAMGVTFHEEAAGILIDNLRRVQVQAPGGERRMEVGEYVEPVYLQVLCQRLWARARPTSRAEPEIRESDIAELGDLDDELADYYDEHVRAAAERTGTSERAIRDWFDEKLLLGGFRSQTLDLPAGEGGGRVVAELEDAHLLRKERRRGALWFELAHDRLIEPIRHRNAVWREANLSLLQRQADLWRAQGRPAGLLLTGDALAKEEEWAAERSDQLTPTDSDFLEACRERRQKRDHERRNTRIVRVLALGLFVLLVGAVFATVWAWVANERLKEEQENATRSLLAAHALSALHSERLDRALLVGIEATREGGPAEARSALLAHVQRSPELVTFLHSPKPAITVATSPDGSLVASGLSSGVIELHDRNATGRPPDRLARGHTRLVGGLAFNADGTLLASSGDDGDIRLWDVPGRRTIATMPGGHSLATSVAFSPDGTRIASGHIDGAVLLWDARTHQLLGTLEGHQQPVNAVAFSPDGQTLASASSDRSVALWDTATQAPVDRLTGHGGAVRDVAFSPDGRTLASGGNDRAVILWDTATRQPVDRLVGHNGFVRTVAFSPDGAALASGSEDETIMLWDVASRRGRPLAGHGDFVTGVAFVGDGSRLASSSLDRSTVIWETGPQLPLGEALEGHAGPANGVAFTADGSMLASAGADGAVVLWDPRRSERLGTLQGHSGPVRSVAFSEDGSMLASGGDDRTVVLWDARSRERLGTLEGHTGAVTSVAFGTDASALASGSADRTVIVWDASTRQRLATLEGHQGGVTSVAFSPDGARLASGGEDQRVEVWDARTHQRVATIEGRSGAVRGVAYDPAGAVLASANADGTVTLWDAKDNRSVVRVLASQGGSLTGVAFSADGRTMASSSDDGTVVLWDHKWDRERPVLGRPFTGFAGPINGVTFGGPEGTQLASAGQDPPVVVWDTDPASWERRACEIANRDLTETEWDQFIGPGRPYGATCRP